MDLAKCRDRVVHVVMNEGTGSAGKGLGPEGEGFGARIANGEKGTLLPRTSEHRTRRIDAGNPHTSRTDRGGVVAGPASHVEIETTFARIKMMEQTRENKWIRAPGSVVAFSNLVVERHLELTSLNQPASTAGLLASLASE